MQIFFLVCTKEFVNVAVEMHMMGFRRKRDLTTRKQAFSTGWEGPKEPVSQPVPRNRDQWSRLKTPGFSTDALGFHWYRLETPTGTKEAATLTQGGSPFGNVFPTGTNDLSLFSFPNPVLFVIFITVYFFIIAKRTQALQYYTFIGRSCSCSFSENIWN